MVQTLRQRKDWVSLGLEYGFCFVFKCGVVVHTQDLSTQKAKAGGSP